MVAIANAAYYQAIKLQSLGNRNRSVTSDEKSSKAEKEHLEHAATMYTKALQKSESNLFAANGLGILLAERGKIEEAKVTFQMVAEGMSAAEVAGGEETANGAAEDRAATFPDIWINQGHIQSAKKNHDAAARHYQQAQTKFFHNLDHTVMLYQARNWYEANDLRAATAVLRRALRVAPWNHRLRFNLAYVLQESACRSVQQTLRAGQKIAGGAAAEDGGTKAAQVRVALENLTLALTLFEQLMVAATAVEATSGGGDEVEKRKVAAVASANLGFDKKRVRQHVQFCQKQLKENAPHLERAAAEDAAFHAKRESLMAERHAEMTKLAMGKAKVKADFELKRKAEEAAAAAARDAKAGNQEYMARSAGERMLEEDSSLPGGGGDGNKKGKKNANANEYVDSDDDDVLAPLAMETGTPGPKTAQEKAALKATGLFSDSEDEEEEAADGVRRRRRPRRRLRRRMTTRNPTTRSPTTRSPTTKSPKKLRLWRKTRRPLRAGGALGARLPPKRTRNRRRNEPWTRSRRRAGRNAVWNRRNRRMRRLRRKKRPSTKRLASEGKRSWTMTTTNNG